MNGSCLFTIWQQFCCISRPEKEGIECGPHIHMCPVLTHHISRVELAGKMSESNNTCSDDLPDAMIRQRIVLFVELGMWHCAAGHHRLVVTKQVCLVQDQVTKILECQTNINDLVTSDMSRNILGTIGRCLHCGLLLGKPIDWGLVQQMQDSCDSSPHNEAVAQIGINPGIGENGLS